MERKKGRSQAGKNGEGGNGWIEKLGNKGKRRQERTSGEGGERGGVRRRKKGGGKGNNIARKGCEEGREGEKKGNEWCWGVLGGVGLWWSRCAVLRTKDRASTSSGSGRLHLKRRSGVSKFGGVEVWGR